MGKNDYKSKEEKKGELFGIITMIVVAAIFVAIVVLAVTKSTDKSDEEIKTSQAETVSITSESSLADEQPSRVTEKESGSAASRQSETSSSAVNHRSSEMQKELDAENSKYEAEKKQIDEDYDKRIATQQNMKNLVSEKAPNDDTSQFDEEINRLESERKDKLDALQQTHNDNLNAIKAKY